MKKAEEIERELATLRDRLSRLSEAGLRINESLDFETVLQGVLESAQSLTGARYGVVKLLDDSGHVQDSLTSGLTPEESRQLWELPDAKLLCEVLSTCSGPVRLRDFQSHIRSLGLPDYDIPMPVSSALPILAAPVLHGGECVANFYLCEKEGGQEFTPEDEETLVMFACQAALVIANARRHGEEQRARADLEALIDTAAVGVVVFDARTGDAVSFNREMRRIASNLRMPEGSVDKLLEVLTFRRADGREVSLEELPLTKALGPARLCGPRSSSSRLPTAGRSPSWSTPRPYGQRMATSSRSS